MKKYAGLAGPETPTIIRGLPELHYPHRLNAAAHLLEWTAGADRDRTAYFVKDEAISFDQVRREAHRYANALRRLGLGKDDTVMLRFEDSPELVYALLAVWIIGAIAVPTYVQLRADGLIYRARDCGAKAIIVASHLLGEAESLQAQCPLLKRVVVAPSDSNGRFPGLADLLDAGEPPVDYAETDSDDTALILYTSGSTGNPKGTCHSQSDLLAAGDTYCRYCLGMNANDIVAGPPAIPFALGIGFFVLYPLRFGAAAVLDADKSPQTLVARMTALNVTIVVGVSTYYNRLGQIIGEGKIKLPKLRMALCGGEPLPAQVESNWAAATGKPLEQFLGTTEVLNVFMGLRHGIDNPKSGSIGLPVPGFEISVRDAATFAALDRGQPGLLCVRGPIGTHYLNKPEAQAKTVRDGWNIFQDIVVWEDGGYIRYVSRFDEMIVSAGHSISPAEVEQILMRHPDVAECGCTGAPDATGQRPQIVKAYVVLKGGVAPTEGEKQTLQTFFKSVGAPYMYPREIEFVASLPRTLNGKIQRSELKKIAYRSH